MSAVPGRRPSVRARALRYLAAREHTRAELERKLLAQLLRSRHHRDGGGDGTSHADANDDERGETAGRLAHTQAAAEVAQALDELQAQGLLDDRRAADALVRAKSARLGDRALRRQLGERGLGADDIDDAMKSLGDDELARARALWRRRFGALPADASERARQTRFLLGRGFSADTVSRVLRGGDGR